MATDGDGGAVFAVEMANAEEASEAIAQFNGSELKGRNIRVNDITVSEI
jgi:RNA recognition motif-containing protein